MSGVFGGCVTLNACGVTLSGCLVAFRVRDEWLGGFLDHLPVGHFRRISTSIFAIVRPLNSGALLRGGGGYSFNFPISSISASNSILMTDLARQREMAITAWPDR